MRALRTSGAPSDWYRNLTARMRWHWQYADCAAHYLGLVPHVFYDATSPHNVAAVVGRFAYRFGELLVGLDHQLDLDIDLGDHSEIRRARLTHLYVMKV